MRSLVTIVLFALLFLAMGSLAVAQSAGTAGQTSPPAPATTPTGDNSAGASKAEVDQLRQEIAAQRQLIEQLKGLVQQLADVKTTASAPDGSRLVNATLTQPAASDAEQAADKKPADKPAGATSGWNGDHFFVKSADGQFQLQPYGYFQTDYRAYHGDAAPPNTFVVRRARFGFQGNYGKYYDFALLIDGAAGNGISLRDLYINIKPKPEFQITVGQFKEPFAQDELVGVTNIDFVERSLASLLYPSASTAYRSPGASIHGDLSGGVAQYWLGAFNGKGILTNNTTNQPEVVGRLRFYPWKKHKDSMIQGLAFGGSVAVGKSRGLSNETSFTAALPDGSFTFFPSFPINGQIRRYNGEFAWVHSRWGVRGEYDELQQRRTGVGSLQSGGLGFQSLPTIKAKAGYLQGTYLLTGETRPENGTPKVKHPVLASESTGGRAWGAWELAFRYDYIQGNEPGFVDNNPFTPSAVAPFFDHTSAYTAGVNWYPNYWVKYMVDFSVDQLKQPSINAGTLPQNYFVVLQRLQFRF